MRAELQKFIESSAWDQVGVGLSVLCAIHCAVTPLFVFFLPVLGAGLGAGLGLEAWGEHFHLMLAALIVPTAAVAFYSGYAHHRHRLVLWAGLPGIFLVAGLPLLQEFFGQSLWGDLSWQMEAAVMIPGSVLLIWAHRLNRIYCRCHSHD